MPGQTQTETLVESRGGLYFNLCEQYKFINILNEHLRSDTDFALHDNNGEVIFTPEQLQKHIESIIFTYSFDKEMGDLGPARDETKEIDLYYKEREWRLVPSNLTVHSGVAKYQPGFSYFHYPFQREDVNMVVVPNEEMRTIVLEFILNLRQSDDERLRQFGANPLPVISYDDLQMW